ncbi:MAG TPA: L-lysine 6-transaminase [Candidatus Kapabacteria bacterium]|nr:L-lysine 6-transaminase [Candidatus Kapabacteria bacterium]HRT67625.1 L-lysine 6-transaminase [Bacteroidota bacterium]
MNAQSNFNFKYQVPPESVMEEISKHLLLDGYDLVLDLQASHNSTIIDERDNKKFVDFFTCFASMPIGFNHPKIADDDFINYIGKVATSKPTNSDVYTVQYATFIKTFFNIAVPNNFKYGFFIDGGALAVENALKAAFDWKIKKNLSKGKGEKGSQVIHFKQAFHGRTGYTMSLTNTDPIKIQYYPKFKWPRITNPKITFPLDDENLQKVMELEKIAVNEIKDAFHNNPDDIAAIIIEPIQGEGGDNHFRPEFLQMLRNLADENEAMLIFDEVQTGLGLTGTFWAFEQMGATPDIFCFGKKTQVCGIAVTPRIDEVPDNVFHTPSRINSTWGGNLTDMVRSTRYLEIIQEENLLDNVKLQGDNLYSELKNLQMDFPNYISNIRHRGLFAAFDLPSADIRKRFLTNAFNNGLIILPSGEKSVRFRPSLNITKDEISDGFEVIRKSLVALD